MIISVHVRQSACEPVGGLSMWASVHVRQSGIQSMRDSWRSVNVGFSACET